MNFEEFYEKLGLEVMAILKEKDLPFQVTLLKEEIKGMGLSNALTGKGKAYDFKAIFDSWEQKDLKEVAEMIVQDAIKSTTLDM